MVKRGLRTAIESMEISLGLTEKTTSEPYGYLKEVLYTKEKLLQRSEGGSMTDMFKTQQANQQHEGQEKEDTVAKREMKSLSHCAVTVRTVVFKKFITKERERGREKQDGEREKDRMNS